jgi:hypothetical protein
MQGRAPAALPHEWAGVQAVPGNLRLAMVVWHSFKLWLFWCVLSLFCCMNELVNGVVCEWHQGMAAWTVAGCGFVSFSALLGCD